MLEVASIPFPRSPHLRRAVYSSKLINGQALRLSQLRTDLKQSMQSVPMAISGMILGPSSRPTLHPVVL